MITRKEDWPTRLHNFLQDSTAHTFSWGEHDCCLLVADAVLAMTEVDLAADYRGQYDDAASAVSLINQLCGGKTAADLCGFVMAQNGCQQLPSVLFAQRGDVVALEDDTIGIVHLDGKHVVCYGQDNCLHLVDLASGVLAWRIG